MKQSRLFSLIVLLLPLLLAGAGCVAKTRKLKESERPKAVQTASLEELVQKINSDYQVIHSFQAKARFNVRSGSAASGELKDYHEIKGFLLYRSPDHLRMIGQIPGFGINALDMVSNGPEFRVSFAPYKKFIIGSALDQPRSKKPLENLRPVHILEALRPLPIRPRGPDHMIFREEVSEGRENYYVIYEVEPSDPSSTTLRRKIWVDRFDLTLARQQLFSQDAVLESDARYEEYLKWEGVGFPSRIDLARPREEYGLTILFEDIKFNLVLEDSKFELPRPEGYELIEVGKRPLTP